MKGNELRFLLWLALCVCIAWSAGAQDAPQTRNEFWPEINAFFHPGPKLRLYLMGTFSREREGAKLFAESPFEGYLGAHLDFIPNKNVILRTGYRYGSSLNGADPFKEHRIVVEETFRRLFPGKLLLSDRNRQDFRFVDGDYSFRYRNRLTLEREFVFRKRAITPYTSGELYVRRVRGVLAHTQDRRDAAEKHGLQEGGCGCVSGCGFCWDWNSSWRPTLYAV